MKRSSYKSIIHLYVLFVIILIVILATSYGMVIYVVSSVKPDGETVLNKWPIDFTSDFSQQIVFIDDNPQVTDTGLELLAKDGLWLQVIDGSGHEALSYDKPSSVKKQYSAIELLELYKSGGNSDYTPFIGSIINNGTEWVYIIGFPVQISKVTMYVDANRFTNGRPIIFILSTVAAFIALILSGIYGLWITRQLFKIAKAVEQIALRSYTGAGNHNVFEAVYDSLNTLDSEIRASDEERKKTEIMREEWIANITHDLKTPLSPIKGYAELLTEEDFSTEDFKRYGDIILKNTVYAEALIDDLKLTYQLKNNMVPIDRKSENIMRFLKEIIIDILNNPKYADRKISFIGQDAPVIYSFDHTLMQRAFNNLIYNSLVHNSPETEITVSFIQKDNSDTMQHEARGVNFRPEVAVAGETGSIYVYIQDNGRGMEQDELDRLFERYYRGTNTEENTGGTGLGMAISKQIIELHGGSIYVESMLDVGMNITIHFPLSN